MTRGQFLRTAGVGAAAVGATVLGMSGVAKAQPSAPTGNTNIAIDNNIAPNGYIVYPTNTAPTDKTNVQWAVTNADNAGTIFLSPTSTSGTYTPFNFGTATAGNTVTVGKSVTITSDSSNRATVAEGFNPFTIVAPGANVTIKNLNSPRAAATRACFTLQRPMMSQ